jgi:hypothetical protein
VVIRRWLRRRRRRAYMRKTFARIRACAHEHRAPNPDATVDLDRFTYEKCLDCGIGLRSNRATGGVGERR